MVIGNDHPHPHIGKYAPYLKNSIKEILYDFEKKMKKFIFQFFDENLLSAWFKDERPQGLSWHSALKDIIPFYDKPIKICFSGFFLVKMVFGII